MQNRVELQRALEAEALELGVKKYRETLLERGTGALPPGKQLLLHSMEPVIATITQYVADVAQGKARRSATVANFIAQFEPETVAYLTAQTVIGGLHERPSVATVASRIGSALEQNMQIDEICKDNKWLADKVTKLRDRYSGKQKMVILRRVAERNDAAVIAWGTTEKYRVGALLLEAFCQSTGLAAIETITTGRAKRVQFVRPTEACQMWLEESHARCELLSPVRLPMLCPPGDWTNPFNGGYLTHRLRQPLVKTRNKQLLAELKHWDMPWVYAAVNAMQATQWAVNEDVFAVLRDVWEGGGLAGGLPARDLLPLPAKSFGPEVPGDDPAVVAWKQEAAKAHEMNAKMESKRLQLVQKLWVAEKMVESGNLFHFVYNADWRGRLYPVASGLNPQGDDVAKALLRFAEAVPLGEEGAYWLAVHGANAYGVDKLSFDERVQWVQDHETAILFAAQAPMASTFWTEADNPYTFLAFCFEWARLTKWVEGGKPQDEFPSILPVAFDGACNGLQNFSAMLRDEVGGAATGLVPGERPSDVYQQVCDKAQALIDQDAANGGTIAARWVGKLSRKLTKRNTMTVPYGVSRYGMRDQLRQELRRMYQEGEAEGLSITPEDAAYLASKNFEAIGQVVIAARRAMDWLQASARVAAQNGLPVKWVAPSGFKVVQDYREEVGEQVDFTALGRRFQFVLNKTGDRLNTRKQAMGISPNYVHSLDAAHLVRTVLFCKEDGITDFAMVHDSYGCHAGNAQRMRDNLRQAFVDQYREDVLAKFRDELVEQIPPELANEIPKLPPMGTLDLEAVRNSEYFFA